MRQYKGRDDHGEEPGQEELVGRKEKAHFTAYGRRIKKTLGERLSVSGSEPASGTGIRAAPAVRAGARHHPHMTSLPALELEFVSLHDLVHGVIHSRGAPPKETHEVINNAIRQEDG
jgi:hypothetical protein